MKHNKRMFKRRQKRHPVKRAIIGLGLLALSFASFSAGVQFAELTMDGRSTRYVKQTNGPGVEARVIVPVKIGHVVGQAI